MHEERQGCFLSALHANHELQALFVVSDWNFKWQPSKHLAIVLAIFHLGSINTVMGFVFLQFPGRNIAKQLVALLLPLGIWRCGELQNSHVGSGHPTFLHGFLKSFELGSVIASNIYMVSGPNVTF